MAPFMAIITVLGLASPAAAQDLTWRKGVRSIIEAQCAACHDATAPTDEEWNLSVPGVTEEQVDRIKATY